MARRWVAGLAGLIVLLLTTVGPALAQEESEPEEFGEPGLYAALLAGYAYDFDATEMQSGVTVNARSSGSPQIGARLGYRIQPPLAVELQFDYLTGADMSARVVSGTPPPGPTSATFEFEALTVTPNVRIYLLPGRIQPYAVVGVGLMWTKLSNFNPVEVGSFRDNTEFSAVVRAGGGLALQFTEQVALELGAEYIRPYGTNQAFRHVSFTAAALYRF